MPKNNKRRTIKKAEILKKMKPAKGKKVLVRKKVHSVKQHKAAVSVKLKLFNRVKKSKILTLRKSQGKKPAKRRNILVHPVKYREAVISSKTKLFNRVKKPIKFAVKIKKSNKKIPKIKKPVFIKQKKAIKQKKKITIKPIKKNIISKKSRIHNSKAIRIKKAIKKPIRRKIIKVKKIVSKKHHSVKSSRSKVSRKARQFKRIKKIVPRMSAQADNKKRQAAQTGNTEFPAESLFKAKIKVIGIGGGGGSIVSEIGRSLEKATFVIADTDIRALKKKSGIKYFWFGEDLTHGLGTGVNVDLAKQAAESAKEKISSIFKDQDIIVFVASLGGGLGSGATQVFVDAARKFGGITLGIFTMPFKFEGKNKYRIAQNALKSLRQSLNVSLVIPNEKIFKIIDTSTPITNAFSIVNKRLIESLESLIDLIYNPGIINIDFADLRTILKGRGNSAFLNTIEELGKDKVEKICENIFKNPLLQNNNFKAEKILFNIAGGENLSMFEVEKISSHIANFNPKAKIIFGISKNSKLKNKIKTTILMTGGQIKEEISREVPVKKIEPIKLIVEQQIKQPFKKETVVIKKEKKKITSQKPLDNNQDKPNKSINKKKEKPADIDKKEQKPVSFIPTFEVPVPSGRPLDLPVVEQNKMNITEITQTSNKKTIRRSGLEIKKAEELQEKKRIAQEKEWEIPAFLRKVKIKS